MGMVTSVDFSERPYKLIVDEEKPILAETVIISTGASAKYLGLENESRLLGKGVSACATCDGAFFREQELAIVGGGDTAMEEALFLTRFASKVYVIHRRNEFRASQIMQDRVLNHEKIEVLWNTTVEDVLGGDLVEGLVIKDTDSGESRNLAVTGFLWLSATSRTQISLMNGSTGTRRATSSPSQTQPTRMWRAYLLAAMPKITFTAKPLQLPERDAWRL